MSQMMTRIVEHDEHELDQADRGPPQPVLAMPLLGFAFGFGCATR